MAIDHDQTFKRLIRESFGEFMELFLPEQAALISFDSVEESMSDSRLSSCD